MYPLQMISENQLNNSQRIRCRFVCTDLSSQRTLLVSELIFFSLSKKILEYLFRVTLWSCSIQNLTRSILMNKIERKEGPYMQHNSDVIDGGILAIAIL